MADLSPNQKSKSLWRSAELDSALIGQRLIEAGLLTEEQLQDALSLQKETGLLLGEVCLLKGWLDYANLKKCLPPLKSKIGEKLMALGYLNMNQLWLALLEQRQSGEHLGEILIRRGWVERDIIEKIIVVKKKSIRPAKVDT